MRSVNEDTGIVLRHEATESAAAVQPMGAKSLAGDETARALAAELADVKKRLAIEIEAGIVLTCQLEQRESLLTAIYHSHSWRLTATLRVVTEFLRDLLRPSPRRTSVPAAVRPSRGVAPPTIFIECTHTHHYDLHTGIQRVVRNIVRHASAVAAERGFEVRPVILENGEFVCADPHRVLADKLALVQGVGNADPLPASSGVVGAPSRLRGLLKRFGWLGTSQPADEFNSRDPVFLDDFASCQGSILLLLDSSWELSLWPAVQRFKARGGNVASVIYDLIPVTHSKTCVAELIIAFTHWIRETIANTETVVCISRAVAQQLIDFMKRDTASSRADPVPVDHFHLGSELDFVAVKDDVRPCIAEVFDRSAHVFLMVGSIEPRKNHAFALDAFDRFWADGGEGRLAIVGRYGWKTDDFLARVENHPQFGTQLFLLRDVNDTELDYAYRNASSLVIASEIEGFGLPVVEAFQRGLPVLCSDIPVFREIADNKAIFFDLADPANLSEALRQFCRSNADCGKRDRVPQPWIGWRESTEQLIDAVLRHLDVGKAVRKQSGS